MRWERYITPAVILMMLAPLLIPLLIWTEQLKENVRQSCPTTIVECPK